MTHRVLTWDWRQQIDLDDLADAIREVSGGRLHLTQVDTGSDQYAVVLSDKPTTAADAHERWAAEW